MQKLSANGRIKIVPTNKLPPRWHMTLAVGISSDVGGRVRSFQNSWNSLTPVNPEFIVSQQWAAKASFDNIQTRHQHEFSKNDSQFMLSCNCHSQKIGFKPGRKGLQSSRERFEIWNGVTLSSMQGWRHLFLSSLRFVAKSWHFTSFLTKNLPRLFYQVLFLRCQFESMADFSRLAWRNTPS